MHNGFLTNFFSSFKYEQIIFTLEVKYNQQIILLNMLAMPNNNNIYVQTKNA